MQKIPQLKCLVAPCGLISFSFGKGNRLVEVIEVFRMIDYALKLEKI